MGFGISERAARDLRQNLAVIDLVVEILDARAPLKSRNSQIARLTVGKERLILIHKADRGDPLINPGWVKYFSSPEHRAMEFSIYWSHSRRALFRYLQGRQRKLSPAFGKRSLRTMVVGIPNVGKSTFINCLVKQRAARTGNRPGVTRGRQWIKLLPGIELLDTPGVLYPRLSKEVVLALSALGSLPPAGVDSIGTARWLLQHYQEKDKSHLLQKRYRGLSSGAGPDSQLEEIGLSLGCLLPGRKIDLNRAAEMVLQDFQNGSLGRMSLESPPE